jgi:hypothetical protein
LNKTEIVKKFITAVQSGDMTMASDCITGDFVLRGWTPRPLEKGEFLAIQNELRTALKGYSFNLSDLNERDDGVEAFIQITGTHTRDLALPTFGVPLVPATGIDVVMPQERVDFTFAGDKIKQMNVESVPGGGVTGLIQQVGSELPVPPRLREIKQLGDTDISQEIEEHQAPEWGHETPITDIDIAVDAG